MGVGQVFLVTKTILINPTDKPAGQRELNRLWSALPWLLRALILLCSTLLLALVLLVSVEWLMRGSFDTMQRFFSFTHRPFWTSVILFALCLTLIDGVLGRLYQAILVVAPVMLLLAWSSGQKGQYLGDPIYPSDLLYIRQVIDLLPLLVRDRPWDALMMGAGAIIGLSALIYFWRHWWRISPVLTKGHRLLRVAFALPLLVWFASISDYATYSAARDRMGIIPMMWDQKENYAHNGLAIAYILNVPMANVSSPPDYSTEQVMKISERIRNNMSAGDSAASSNDAASRPDIIMIMSESFWDPTRLPGVNFASDPMPAVRAQQSGYVFSPEFGGMTANVEFEALTGFSNAFLPYGSIPYQQYIRRPVPSLASFFQSHGYATKALHPYRQWFWNRGTVYQNFGFEEFLSEENLPTLTRRGKLASDEEFVNEVIRAAENTEQPLFLFGVSLQGHGPYAPSRYPDSKIAVTSSAGEKTAATLRSYAQGLQDADSSFQRLLDWANQRSRETIIVFFGDHLPPLGEAYVKTGFMNKRVASRVDAPDQMQQQHETPLVLWSNTGMENIEAGTISPAFLPYYILEMARMQHPYYTGFLGELHSQYRVIDGHLLLDETYQPQEGWLQEASLPAVLHDYRLLQYDLIFGKGYAEQMLFPRDNNAPTNIPAIQAMQFDDLAPKAF